MTMRLIEWCNKKEFVRSILSFGNTLREETVAKIASSRYTFQKRLFSCTFHEYLHTMALGEAEKIQTRNLYVGTNG